MMIAPSRGIVTKNRFGAGFNTGERYVSGSAFAPRIQERSKGYDYRSPYCLPKSCLCGSSLRTSDTDSPNTHYLCRPRSSRTTEHWRSPPVRDRSSPMQEQRQPPKLCVSSSFKTPCWISNNTKDVVAIADEVAEDDCAVAGHSD